MVMSCCVACELEKRKHNLVDVAFDSSLESPIEQGGSHSFKTKVEV